MPARLYLDNAATSFPKPPAVHEAMLRYATQVGGTAGRGAYLEAREGARVINQCRARLCQLFGAGEPDHVVFTLNTTDALNLAIKGLVIAHRRGHPGRPFHVLTTALDHNSILRPLSALAARGEIEWTCLPVDAAAHAIDPGAIRAAIRPHTRLIALTHASNVTGAIQPIAEIGAIAREHGILFLVDAAQSLGHIPVDVAAMKIDLLAFPGHKGLLGPLGTGGLFIRPGVEPLLDPIREGGTGSRSELDTQPGTLPDKYEPGSQNAVGIAGLSEGAAWHLAERAAGVNHERTLIESMLDALRDLDALGPHAGRRGLRLLGPPTAHARVGVFTLTHDTLSAHELGTVMEQEYRVLGRAGLHCAPRAHGALGTPEGAYRLSLGPFITDADIARTHRALAEVAGAAIPNPTSAL